jgi:ABC-type polysaccharide/polyol phosphate transport system ATPase subunit
MSSDYAIEFKNVTKKYSKYFGLLKFKNFLDRLKNGQFTQKLVKEEDFYALKEASFTLRKGERVGIIGPNGAGKSTSLKLIQGVAFPNSGEVKVNGKVGGLIELGSGFSQDLTGRENVYLNTAIQGFSKAQTNEIYERIVEIAELQNFMDVPLKRYSSGMKVRLGFATAMASVPDIVLLDEVLAVGDARFKKKSMAMIEEYLEGRTLLFVSHAMDQVKKVCERVLVLNHGNIVFDGDPKEAVEVYNEIQKKGRFENDNVLVQKTKRGFSEIPKVEITKLSALNSGVSKKENSLFEIRRGERLAMKVEFKYRTLLGALKIKVIVKSSVMGQISEVIAGAPLEIPEEEAQKAAFEFSFCTKNLKPGDYSLELTPEFIGQSSKTALVIHRKAFKVTGEGTKTFGLLDLDFQTDSQKIDLTPEL